ncbi:hypothetical protein RRG08_005978 [Elysia crispata]|uniref:Uncharacterized protein n=1 Tax=Elysia crispata TaxID=231223 RepID=A0AAE1D2W1_9GAST|nr:hypothetical protein RRG08_005978 [Elysia crispata]
MGSIRQANTYDSMPATHKHYVTATDRSALRTCYLHNRPLEFLSGLKSSLRQIITRRLQIISSPRLSFVGFWGLSPVKVCTQFFPQVLSGLNNMSSSTLSSAGQRINCLASEATHPAGAPETMARKPSA